MSPMEGCPTVFQVIYNLMLGYHQVVCMAVVGSFPFNSFLSGVLSCVGTSILAERPPPGFAFPFCQSSFRRDCP
ncbi:hypothetical protein ACS0TY_000078 [Phlomoides rotata]